LGSDLPAVSARDRYVIVTVIPFRNLKLPVLTTISPAFNPCVIATKSPRDFTDAHKLLSNHLRLFAGLVRLSFYRSRKPSHRTARRKIADPGTTSVLCSSGNVTSALANIPGS